MAKKKVIFEIDEALDEEFRKTVVEQKGLHKGVIKESLEEAMVAWIKEQKKKKQQAKQDDR